MNSNANSASPPSPIILATIGSQDHFWPLLSLGYALAKSQQGQLTILTTTQSGQLPDWLTIPSAYQDMGIVTTVVKSEAPAPAILNWVRKTPPDLLLVGWRSGGRGLRPGGTLDIILKQAPCDIVVVRADPTWPEKPFSQSEKVNILIPLGGGPNALLAMNMALGLTGKTHVTALNIASEHTDTADFLEHQTRIKALTELWAGSSRLKTKVVRAESVFKGVMAESGHYDMTMLGASEENVFDQMLFGDLPHRVALENPHTTIIVKQKEEGVSGFFGRLWWRLSHLLPGLSVEDRSEVYKQIRRGARPKTDFFMMIGLSSGIAALGLMLDSPAVIIGAMLVAPLMAAIMGMGLGVIQADGRLLQLAVKATAQGMLLAMLGGVLVGLIMPHSQPTAEMISRTAPSLLDLGVALVSGLAGAYALCRKDVSASLPGVAIAAALVPPLTTAGIGLAWARWDIAGGAFLLFFTNLVAIVAAGGFIYFLLGFRPKLKKEGRSRIFKRGLLSSGLLLAGLIWILSSLTIQSVQETRLRQTIDQVLNREIKAMAGNIKLDTWQLVELPNGTLSLEVEVRAPTIPAHHQAVSLQDRVAAALPVDHPIALTLISLRTTELDPVVPPTPTFTPTSGPTPTFTNTPPATATPIPSATFASTPTPTLTATATGTPEPTAAATTPPPLPATATPGITFTPLPTATPAVTTGVITGTEGKGVVLHWSAGGLKAAVLPENSVVMVFTAREEVDGLLWLQVQDALGRNGWIAARYVEIIP